MNINIKPDLVRREHVPNHVAGVLTRVHGVQQRRRSGACQEGSHAPVAGVDVLWAVHAHVWRECTDFVTRHLDLAAHPLLVKTLLYDQINDTP